MSNYVKATNFTAKDSLPSGNAGKIIKGAELDTEYTAIAAAVSSKADSNSPTFTGTPIAPTASAGTNTTQLATTAFVTGAIAAEGLGTIATQDSDAVTITGGSITGITDLAVADGGTGSSTLTANAVLLGDGTSALQSVAPSTSGNVLTSNGTTWTSAAPAGIRGLGFGGETWHGISMSAGTPYTNNYGYPIMVVVSLTASSASPTSSQFYVGGVLVGDSSFGGWTGTGNWNASAIVPPGATYQVNGRTPNWASALY